VSALPEPGPINPGTGLPTMPLGPYDVIAYDVIDIEGMKGEVTIDGEGSVSIPVAGRFKAAGLTVEQLEDQVETGLRENHVRNPRVTINLKEMVSQRVTVEGAVQRAGSYPILPRMTLQRSVASAQGLSEFAKSSQVVVFRSIGGAQYATLYDLKAIREGRYDDPAIYPNDIVVVGESRASRLFNNLVPAAASLLSPLTILLTR